LLATNHEAARIETTTAAVASKGARSGRPAGVGGDAGASVRRHAPRNGADPMAKRAMLRRAINDMTTSPANLIRPPSPKQPPARPVFAARAPAASTTATEATRKMR